jgi:hypothetical protein
MDYAHAKSLVPSPGRAYKVDALTSQLRRISLGGVSPASSPPLIT